MGTYGAWKLADGKGEEAFVLWNRLLREEDVEKTVVFLGAGESVQQLDSLSGCPLQQELVRIVHNRALLDKMFTGLGKSCTWFGCEKHICLGEGETDLAKRLFLPILFN